uniref:Polymerase nucleotidyl transferase domain-containing protein n=1 Tax=Candidatus Kentrum sp. TC TaxID=2126339 RepID=A0A450ZB09_9GAMM|nr:MAG: hypothetical protein BECKTC1821D_GA0114238_11206 [Candidatus Kentron sp. TC]VFK64034.1 MAG: hypothetical protein BECKTC1821F_GA0114240_11135 [Candidatus Kentron sp. TC]
MRLTDRQRRVIRDAARQAFGPGASVRLFGSRLDDSRKGGDIDLLVETPTLVEDAGLAAARMSARIQMQLGERKIDILYLSPDCSPSPIHRAALERGIRL